MIRIGICDDTMQAQQAIYDMCENYFSEVEEDHQYILFSSGEEVLLYCENEMNERIDLLFLDIEMPGISGVETKDMILKKEQIWRIVFVSSYIEQVYASFGLKTMGFVVKPAKQEEIHKWIGLVLEDMKEDVLIELKSSEHEIGEYVRLEDIAYIKANGNYTQVHLYSSTEKNGKCVLLTKKMGDVEEEIERLPIVRVHKSYMVNLVNVIDIKTEVVLRNREERIPIGRAYREKIRRQYIEFQKEKVKRRI